MHDRYLNLLRDALTGVLIEDRPLFPVSIGPARVQGYVAKLREYGRDVPSTACTMIGTRRMDNVRRCIEQVLADDVPGDLMETGVWRGGATIVMRGRLEA